jgi:hypothetical protein
MTPGQKLISFRLIFVAIAVCLVASRAHSAPGDLYVAEATGGGHIYKFTPAGTKSTVASGIYQPVALAFDRAGNLFVGNSGAGNPPMPSSVIRIAPDGTQSAFATLQSTQLLGLAFDGAGNLFVSTGTSILKIAPDGTQSTFASQLHGVWPLAFDRSGNLYAGVNPVGPSFILKFAPDGSSDTFIAFSGPGSSVTDLAFGPRGDLFAIHDDSILKIRSDGNSTVFAPGNPQWTSLAFDAAGTLFAGQNAYSTSQPTIFEFSSTGASTIFASGVLLPRAFAFEPVTEKVRNISARGLVGGGDNTLIGGFIIGGSALANNAVLVRAIGPSLASAGVTNPLSDPILDLHDSSGAVIATNNDWQDTQKAQISATGLAPTDAHESAIFATLPNGNYTAVVRSADSTVGTAVVEVFSVSQ